MNVKAFVFKLILWIGATVVAPILIINKYFVLFSRTSGQMKFHGWGIVCVIILVCVLNAALSYVIDVLNNDKKSIVYAIKWIKFPIVPLCMILMLVNTVYANIYATKRVLTYILFCMIIATFLNPFPELNTDRK